MFSFSWEFYCGNQGAEGGAGREMEVMSFLHFHIPFFFFFFSSCFVCMFVIIGMCLSSPRYMKHIVLCEEEYQPKARLAQWFRACGF